MESLTEESDLEAKPAAQTEEKAADDLCAICLQPFIFPAKLPCGHIFCFLCIKGITFQNRRCAMCRRQIPVEFLDSPDLLNVEDLENCKIEEASSEEDFKWFYKGSHGWWQYDERSSQELENAFKKKERICELLIAGFMYVIDFDKMLQTRKHGPLKYRRIKRDLASVPKKGIAGVRFATAVDEDDSAEAGASGSTLEPPGPSHDLGYKSQSPIPIPPTNTPQTPHTPSANSESSSPNHPDDHSLRQAIQGIQHTLRLRDDAEYNTDSEPGEDEVPDYPDLNYRLSGLPDDDDI